MRKNTLLAVFLAFATPSLHAVTGPFTGKTVFASQRDGNFEIYVMNANGTAQTRLTNGPSPDTHPAWSPDGSKIAFASERDGNNEIYVMNANGTNQTRITFDDASDSQPTWSPDGTKIAFQSARGGSFDIFIMNADGSNVVQLTNDPGFDIDPSFSGDGRKIAFSSSRDGNFEIYSMNPDGTGQTRLTNNTVSDWYPDFSPNGNAIVFATQVPGGAGPSLQIAIMSAAGLFPTVLTAAGANSRPAFSGDGKRIFFHSTRDQNNIEIYSMAVDGSDETRHTNNLFLDTMPDSQRLLHVESIGVYRPATGQWHLRNTNTPGPADLILTLGGQPGDLPVAGNWNGDQRTDIGIFRNGTFLLGNIHSAVGFTFIEHLPPIAFGQPGDLPVAGDWNGDGIDDVGVFRPGVPGKFILRLPGGSGGGIFPLPISPSITFNFGTLGDLPVAGDWDGDGVETVGVFRPGNGGDNATFLLTNDFNGTPELTFALGTLGNLPLAGDWLGVGKDDIGIFLDLLPGMLLSVDGKVSFSVTFGQVGDFPVAGNWTP